MRLNLEDKIECNDRETTKDSFPYCRENNINCPYIVISQLVDLGIKGSFYKCDFMPLKRSDVDGRRDTERRDYRKESKKNR